MSDSSKGPQQPINGPVTLRLPFRLIIDVKGGLSHDARTFRLSLSMVHFAPLFRVCARFSMNFRRVSAALLIALFTPAILWSLANVASAKPPKDAMVMAMQIDDIISLDPAEIFEFSGAEYAAQVYDRLVTYDLNDVSQILPSVAESWTVSEDGKTFTFDIRSGIRFHSGAKLTARDVAYSLQRVVRLGKTPSFILTQFGLTPGNVEDRIKADGKRTLTFTTDKAYAPSFVLYCLTANVASIVDSELVKDNEANGDEGHNWLRTHSAGSSAYKLSSWRPNEMLVYDRNIDFWRGRPGVKRVFVRHVPESATQRLMIETGEIDVARNLTADQIAALSGSDEINIISRPQGQIIYLSVNVGHPPFDKPEVRQALKYLVDYDGIANTLLAGQAQTHQAFLPLGFLGAIEDKPFTLNIQKAKDLLTAAGVSSFKTTVDVRNLPEFLRIAETLQATFGQAGIEVEILPGDGKQVLTKYRARNHDMHLGSWGPDYQDPHTNAQTFAANPDPSETTSLPTLAWRNQWNPVALTLQTNAAVQERDPVARAAIYEAIQREHQATSPFVIMFQRIGVFAERKGLRGLIWGPSFDTYYYWQATKEPPKS
jgi:peptide/nickel transport system substrate-binding protein